MKIDLHSHSSWSDGSEIVETVFREAKKQEVDVLALTDHDTTRGWDEAREIAAELGIGFVPGIEITTRAHPPGEKSFGVHLLAYLPDPNNGELVSALENTLRLREERLAQMFELIRAEYELDWQDVLDQLRNGATHGRPSIAAAMVSKGHFASTTDVFNDLWGPGSAFYIPNKDVVDTIDAIRLVAAAGGVPIIAHPMSRGKGPEVGQPMPRAHFEEMIAAGLAGFEVDHRDVPPHAQKWLREMASEFDLILTGSSDYHGNRKENVLGEHSTSKEMLDRIVAQATGTQAQLQ
jgi:predicted metal-dependent phosphoesterase TrpH